MLHIMQANFSHCFLAQGIVFFCLLTINSGKRTIAKDNSDVSLQILINRGL